MINWSKYFDKIYCINFSQYTERKQLMQFQLNRVGILNSGIFEWHTTFNVFQFDQYLKNKYSSYTNYNTSLMLGHYNIIRDALYKNYNHILIIEDDERFLKDLNKIQEILENKPDDGDVILYDKMLPSYVQKRQFISINNYYSTFNCCWSAGCYQLNKRGMERLKKSIQEFPGNIDARFDNINRWLPQIKCYCSNINLSVQCTFQNSYSSKLVGNVMNWQLPYKYLEIHFDDYMIRKDGSPYYYGDYIEEVNNNLLKITENSNIDLNKNIIPTTINIFSYVYIKQIYRIYFLLYSLSKYSQSKFNIYIMLNTNHCQQYYSLFKPFINDKFNITLLNNNILEKKDLNYCKKLIPTLFSNLDRILYLDYNTILIKKGIEQLYNIDFKNNYLAAVKYNNQLLNTSFNTDIFLFNIKQINDENINLSLSNDQFNQQILLNKILQINPIFNNNIDILNNDLVFKIKSIFKKWNFKDVFDYRNNIMFTKFQEQNYNKLFYINLLNKYNIIKQELTNKLHDYYLG